MSQTETMRKRLKFNRPSVRRHARPPRQRTALGNEFTAANLPVALALQHCADCGRAQYPPREVCSACLGATLHWREADTSGVLLAAVDLHNSLWEYFKRRIRTAPWPVASVRLDCGVTVFAHCALDTFSQTSSDTLPTGSPVTVFSHTDCSLNAVLIAVSADTPVGTAEQRREIADMLGITRVALREDGI